MTTYHTKMKYCEHLFQCQVVEYLTECGIPCFSVPNHLLKGGLAEAKREISGGLRKGAPDLIAGVNGKSYWLELKTPTGHQSLEQKAFAGIAPKFGATYLVVRKLDDLEGLIWQKNQELHFAKGVAKNQYTSKQGDAST